MSPTRILRKTFALSLAILLTAAVFAGCGKKGKEDLCKGKAAYEIGKYDEAAMYFALAAQDGNAEAQFLLGKCYMDGKGVEEDIDKAMKWFNMAADKGVAEAKTIISDYNTRSKSDFENGHIILSGDLKLELVKVEAGTFEMSARDGDNFDNEVSRRATLTKDFYIGRTEVTQTQWKAVMGTNPSYFKGNDLPVEQISWNDAMDFCEKLNDMGRAPIGWKFTLPTETQWEYVARGGKKSKGFKYSGSNDIDDVAWYWDNADEKTHPVGQKKANELGIYDMSGNVYEWCLDDWQEKSDRLTAEFTRGNDRGSSRRVGRGGCWEFDARLCRSASRSGSAPGNLLSILGFRVALVPESY